VYFAGETESVSSICLEYGLEEYKIYPYRPVIVTSLVRKLQELASTNDMGRRIPLRWILGVVASLARQSTSHKMYLLILEGSLDGREIRYEFAPVRSLSIRKVKRGKV